jgi:predicted O-methyltransferase YrrM
MKTLIERVFNYIGFVSSRKYNSLERELRSISVLHKEMLEGMRSDFSPEELKLIQRVEPFTMTSPERLIALIRSLDYILENNIEGDFVECGVWRGGSAMLMANALLNETRSKRKIFLYDTFEGMVAPTVHDKDNKGVYASSMMRDGWCMATAEEVRQNLLSTGIDAEKLKLVKGKVEVTLQETTPSQIALLRLDTDWYESTKLELNTLYDLVSPGGVIIIDDYGHWSGCKKAVDEFISSRQLPILLSRIDYTGRLFVKPVKH